MVNAIEKGKRGERKACHKLEEILNLPRESITRSQQHSGKGESSADVIGIDALHFEVKHRKKVDVFSAMQQAKRDSKNKRIPVCVTKRNYSPWLISVEADNLVEFCKVILETYQETPTRKMKRVPIN